MWKKCAKATHIFLAKHIRILSIESAKSVNEITLNELVKLTTLWTTGPRMANSVDPDETATFKVYVLVCQAKRVKSRKNTNLQYRSTLFDKIFYFIVSGENSVYLVKIKVVSITSELISYHFTSGWYDLYFHFSLWTVFFIVSEVGVTSASDFWPPLTSLFLN